MPHVDSPVISVGASLPGADPATMASSVAAPLERRLGQIAGVNEMTSISTLGGANVTLQFDLTRNIDGAARDVQAAISAAANDLPIDLPGPPTSSARSAGGSSPCMILAMTSDTLPLTRVFEYGNDIVAQEVRARSKESARHLSAAAPGNSAVREFRSIPAALASTGFEPGRCAGTCSGQINVDLPQGKL